MSRTLIQKHSSAIVGALVEKVKALTELEHKLTKGELRELFVSNVLTSFLTSQLSIGTGVIINRNGAESNQTDIIIYDNRILPPFIKEQNVGVYPSESVIATIEVKSWLRKSELFAAESAAKKLRKEICTCNSRKKLPISILRPLCAVVGFYGNGVKELSSESGKQWLEQNIKHVFAVCLVNRYSWMRVVEPSWRIIQYDRETHEETKRFIAVFLDNVRTHSDMRFNQMAQLGHKDWFSEYIRK